MRIAVDAMGGDHAPLEVVKGSIEAARELGAEILLVGNGQTIKPQLEAYKNLDSRVSLVEASQIVDFHEPPARAVRDKPDSSIVVGMRLLKARHAVAFVSAGHTGAIVCAALWQLGKLQGVLRPALATVVYTSHGPVLLLDIGANADCRPIHLLQFAQMGHIYMSQVLGIAHPKVGLLSNGEEESKGNATVRQAYHLLKESSLNFVGNVEGKDIHLGQVHVVVTDGFTGNVVIKASEGMAESIFRSLVLSMKDDLRSRLAGLLLRPALRRLVKRADYSEYGGAPLLGVRGNIIIAHGRSQAKAIKNAIAMAQQIVGQGMPEALMKGVYHG